MWNCIEDLRTGKALSLYYYNIATSIPLYLHITMAADNDSALFFWWSASTIRHLGIGGRYGCKTVTPADLKPYDLEKRAALYQSQTQLYKQLKAYFVRGEFHGINETCHLHVLPDLIGGVLVVFNLSESEKTISIILPYSLLKTTSPFPVTGALANFHDDLCVLDLTIPAMAPAVVLLGDAVPKSF
jgi:hypothetical protein